MSAPGLRTLSWATSVEALPTSRVLHRRDGDTAGYHVLGLYESLGLTRSERTAGVCRAPLSPVRR